MARLSSPAYMSKRIISLFKVLDTQKQMMHDLKFKSKMTYQLLHLMPGTLLQFAAGLQLFQAETAALGALYELQTSLQIRCRCPPPQGLADKDFPEVLRSRSDKQLQRQPVQHLQQLARDGKDGKTLRRHLNTICILERLPAFGRCLNWCTLCTSPASSTDI